MKQIFDWLREQVPEKILTKVSVTSIEQCARASCYNKMLALIDEAEVKWEAELRKHDIEVHNKAIAEFEEQMKFEYRESVGTTKRERHFAEAVIEQVAHSLTEVE